MFHKMRRHTQQLTIQESIHILEKNTSGTLALLDEDNYPYAVPLSYVYHEGKLYFHSAKQGHKIEAIHHHSKASFCVIDQDEVHGNELTTYYRSVIAFGKVKLLDNQDKEKAIYHLGLRFCDNKDFIHDEINRFKDAFEVIELDIEHLSGKKAKELL